MYKEPSAPKEQKVKPGTLQDIFKAGIENCDFSGLPEEKIEKIKKAVELIKSIEESNNVIREKLEKPSKKEIYNTHFESVNLFDFKTIDSDLELLEKINNLLIEIIKNKFFLPDDYKSVMDEIKKSVNSPIKGYLSNLLAIL